MQDKNINDELDFNFNNFDDYVVPEPDINRNVQEQYREPYMDRPIAPPENEVRNGINYGFELKEHRTLERRVVYTDEGAVNGQDKCPKCGATDISFNKNTGLLRCNFCRHEFAPEYVSGLEEDISNLSGEVVASGALDIQEECDDIVTIKCSGCGAEVVINSEEHMQARCHWCRSILSINKQIPNGAVPDIVLPFDVQKEEAEKLIRKFVNKRRFFALPRFKKEFTTENIMGVYFPYMVVDINGHATYVGQAEHLVRKYTVGSDENERTYYDADLYDVEREFDIAIEGLTIEASEDKLRKNDESKTNNIINSIMPFDVENAVKWNANYMKGYSSEKRDVNIDFLRPNVEIQAEDVSRFAANESMEYYNRGAKWDKQELDIKGEQWKAAHLPVWLYSYYEQKGKKSKLHYVAVNARTRETMGSVPINMFKLWFVTLLLEFLSFGAIIKYEIDARCGYIAVTAGVLFFLWMYGKYRNSAARHTHEKETTKKIANLRTYDQFVCHRKKQKEARMTGANNEIVNGNQFSDDAITGFKKNIKIRY